MIHDADNVKAEQRPKNRLVLLLQFAIGLGSLLGALLPLRAQVVPRTDELSVHLQRAEQLLQNQMPSAALWELEVALAIGQEPRVLYLQGLAQKKLGRAPEALLLLHRFQVASTVASCCREERRDAARLIVELRHLMESGDSASELSAGGRAEPTPQPTSGQREVSSVETTPAPAEYTAHVQRAKQLLRSKKPSDALAELDAAFDIRQEPLGLYLQGLARQELGMKREAVVLFQRFLVAAAGSCCADEQAYASHRIAKLRPSLTPHDLVTGSPLAQPTPPPALAVLTTDGDDVYFGTVSLQRQSDSTIEVTTRTGAHISVLLKNVLSLITDRQAGSLPEDKIVPTTCYGNSAALTLIRQFTIGGQPPLRAELLRVQPGRLFRILRSVNGTEEIMELPWEDVERVSRPADVRDKCYAVPAKTTR